MQVWYQSRICDRALNHRLIEAFYYVVANHCQDNGRYSSCVFIISLTVKSLGTWLVGILAKMLSSLFLRQTTVRLNNRYPWIDFVEQDTEVRKSSKELFRRQY